MQACLAVRRCTGLLTCLGRPFALDRTLHLSLFDLIPPCLSNVPWIQHRLFSVHPLSLGLAESVSV